MTTTQAKTLEATIDVAAPADRVWALVSDLRRMARWSPQVVTSIQRGPVGAGSRALNINRSGWKVWPTRSQVVRFEPGREIAFRIAENKQVWSYRLEPTADGGTHVVQRREGPDGLSAVSAKFQGLLWKGTEAFDAEILAGMKQTLERLKADAER